MRLAIVRTAALACFCALAAAPAASTASGLDALLVEGHELHASLETRDIGDGPLRHVPRGVVTGNPQLSTDPDFIRAIAASGSQGRLGAEGVDAALYALFAGERDLGFYGLEMASTADADRREAALRDLWSHNISIDRARVHRGGRVLVVVWTDGVPTEAWEAVNAGVAQRLAAP